MTSWRLATLDVDTAAAVAVMQLEQTPAEREAGTTRVSWSDAGHPPPFVIDPDGTIHALTADRADLLIGARLHPQDQPRPPGAGPQVIPPGMPPHP